MYNYNGFDYEYDNMFGWVVYDENGCPISRSFKTLEDVIAYIEVITM